MPTSTTVPAPPAGGPTPPRTRAGHLVGIDSLVRVVVPRFWVVFAALAVFLGGVAAWGVFGTVERRVDAPGVLVPAGGVEQVRVAQDGVLQSFSVSEGATVGAGQAIASVVDDQGDVATVTSAAAGTVEGLMVSPGSLVTAGEVVAVVVDPDVPLEAVGTVAAAEANAIAAGQTVRVVPIGLNTDGLETIEGTVASISQLPVSEEQLASVVGSPSLAAALTAAGPVKSVVVQLATSDATSSGYTFSNDQGQAVHLAVGMSVELQVVVSSERPIDQVLR